MEDEILDIDENEIDVKSKVAGKGVRFANTLIDSLVVGIPINIISNRLIYGEFVFIEPENAPLESQLDGLLIYTFIHLLYFIIMEHTLGKTIGKMITGTKVVNHQGEKPTLGQIIGRSFARYIPFDAFSFLGESGIGWHDSLSRTYVIPERK